MNLLFDRLREPRWLSEHVASITSLVKTSSFVCGVPSSLGKDVLVKHWDTVLDKNHCPGIPITLWLWHPLPLKKVEKRKPHSSSEIWNHTTNGRYSNLASISQDLVTPDLRKEYCFQRYSMISESVMVSASIHYAVFYVTLPSFLRFHQLCPYL